MTNTDYEAIRDEYSSLMYLSGVDCAGSRVLAKTHGLGLLPQPDSYRANKTEFYPYFGLDNGCFAAKWDEDKWLAWLDKMPRDRCLFATVPDVVGDAELTFDRWWKYNDKVKDLGFNRAYVLQDGCEDWHVPEDAEAVFIGGSTEFKLSDEAAALTSQARQQGKWVHMGRANSAKRLSRAVEMNCDSADGTFLKYGPLVNTGRLRNMLDSLPARRERKVQTPNLALAA